MVRCVPAQYELLEPVADGVYGHECFLKAAYVNCTADDTDPMAGYGTWSSSDAGWVGHSGPEVCPGDQEVSSLTRPRDRSHHTEQPHAPTGPHPSQGSSLTPDGTPHWAGGA